jgi:putative peptidoglycan lipid II flippase
MTKVFQPSFMRAKTQDPMQFAIVSVVVNIARALCCHAIRPCRHCMGTSIAAWINASFGDRLSRRNLFTLDARMIDKLPRIILSGMLMGAILLAVPGFSAPTMATGAAF